MKYPTHPIRFILTAIFAATALLSVASGYEERISPASAVSRIDDTSGDGKGGEGDNKIASILRAGDTRKEVEMRVVVQLPIARYSNDVHEAGKVLLQFDVKDTLGSAQELQIFNIEEESDLGIEFSAYHLPSKQDPEVIKITTRSGTYSVDITEWAKAAVLSGKSMLTLRLQAKLDESGLRGNAASDHFWIEAEGVNGIRMAIME